MTTGLINEFGQHYICLAEELLDKKKTMLKEVPIVYRWWFHEESEPMKALANYIKAHPEDCQMKYLLSRLLQKRINEQQYYALYFGQSVTGKTRFARHINGPLKNSTLRKTIATVLKLLDENPDKGRISKVLKVCYFEWLELPWKEDAKLIDIIEMVAIGIGNYPLNIDGNNSVSKDWLEMITNERKQLKP